MLISMIKYFFKLIQVEPNLCDNLLMWKTSYQNIPIRIFQLNYSNENNHVFSCYSATGPLKMTAYLYSVFKWLQLVQV